MSERSGRLLLDGAFVPGRVRFADGRLTAVERLAAVADDAALVVPGLVDLHVHGYGGADPLEDLAGLSLALARTGTTAYLPTLFPGDPARLGVESAELWARARDLAPGTARVLGTHLEGPFVNPEKAGGLPRDRLVPPSPAALAALLGSSRASDRGIRQLTIAPELPGALELVRELAGSGVRVSLGHTVASADDAARAAEAGAGGATHLFNAMDGLHHRRATLAGFALATDALVAELIGDLVHVGAQAIRIALRARGAHGLALVSDALRAAGTSATTFESHGRRCRVREGAIWLEEDDPRAAPRLTGAEACQMEAVRRLARAGVVAPAAALTMASETPARALGLEDELGRLVVGARADLLLLDARRLEPLEVLVGGTAVPGVAAERR